MRFDAALFDLDGTLADTLADLADCMNAVLAAAGMPTHPDDAYRYFVGNGMANLVAAAAPAGTPGPVLQDLRARMHERYAANWAVKTRPYPGIPELLAGLRARGLRLGVLSNKPDPFTRAMVERFFPGVFAAVAGAREGVPIKPDPAGALAVAAALGAAPDRCLYLGDTNTDMRTGRAAGMYAIGVSWGFRPVHELEEAGALAVVHAPADVLNHLE